ncbi:hypothetical protein ACLM44_02855 [Synechococcus sp. W2B2]|uniref:hypothetical protein n=1 Tax=Synechococcus sp. W2B2 TaxID=3392296 RepID=UPI0012E9B980
MIKPTGLACKMKWEIRVLLVTPIQVQVNADQSYVNTKAFLVKMSLNWLGMGIRAKARIGAMAC